MRREEERGGRREEEKDDKPTFSDKYNYQILIEKNQIKIQTNAFSRNPISKS